MKSSTHIQAAMVLWLLIAAISFSACSKANNSDPTFGGDPAMRSLPVSTSTRTASSTPADIATIEATRTATFVPSPPPTWTPFPAIAKDKLPETIRGYFSENGGCSLPCWWGVEPGVTDWPIAVQQFDALDPQPSAWSDQTSVGNVEMLEQTKGYRYAEDAVTISWSISAVNEKVSKVTIFTDRQEQFGLAPLLKNIGAPEQIYLKTFQNVPGYPDLEPFIPFSLVLHYESKHMVVWYQMQGQINGANIIACNRNVEIYVWIWAEELVSENYENYVLNMAGGGHYGKKYLRGLEDATPWNKEKFTEIFQNNEDVCITTPAGMW